MNEPQTIRAGDTIGWTEDLQDYLPANGWSLKYRILWAAGAAYAFTAVVVNTTYGVTLTATDTASFIAGNATLVAYVEKGAGASLERETLSQTALTILTNLTTTANLDSRSEAKKALDDLNLALAAHIAGGSGHISEYEILGRRMKFRDTKSITDLIAHYEIKVAKENANLAILQGGSPGRVQVRF